MTKKKLKEITGSYYNRTCRITFKNNFVVDGFLWDSPNMGFAFCIGYKGKPKNSDAQNLFLEDEIHRIKGIERID